MSRFTYRIDRYFSDTEGWGPENDDARGTEDYDGTAELYAREVLDNRMEDIASERLTGRWRVLAWEGDEERDGGPEDADGWAESVRTEAHYPSQGGRPEIGPEVKTRVTAHERDRMDTIAKQMGLPRAAFIREAIQARIAQFEAGDITTYQRAQETAPSTPAEQRSHMVMTPHPRGWATSVTVIASNGRENSEADPIPTWGYTGPEPVDGWDFQFAAQVEYRDGDTIDDAVTRLQAAGHLPVGKVEVVQEETLDDYWIHEDHQTAYTVKITPA